MAKAKEYWGDLKKIYRFIMYDDSIWSWILNIIIAFILVKFIIYPVLGFALGTSLPLVAVISGSMEHDHMTFDNWWEKNEELYKVYDIDKEEFSTYKFKNGFYKGDVIVLGRFGDSEVGDVLVYKSYTHNYPIIHRVIYINDEDNTFQFKGDNGETNKVPDSGMVEEDQLLGRALFKIPYVGWLKIAFTDLLRWTGTLINIGG